jgi:predicted AAA+ superfamily ATPase
VLLSQPPVQLPQPLIDDLRRQNPWWFGAPLPPLPPFGRWPSARLHARLQRPLAAILAIRGPRQIGKPTLQQQLIIPLLEEGVASNRILRVQYYLRFLDSSLLLRTIQPLEIRLKRSKGYDKLCLSDQTIHLVSLGGPDLAHFPERDGAPEVNYVATIGDQRIPIEVKHQRGIDPPRDTVGLCAYLEKTVNNASFGWLITRDDATQVDDPRIIALPFKSLLLIK